jgi:mRNA interferase RelE/StbE
LATRRRIVEKVEALQNDLAGDVKKLTNFTPEYRLRVGEYRVLFEVEGARVVIYRVVHRKDAH